MTAKEAPKPWWMRRQSLWLRRIPLGRFNPAVELRRAGSPALACAAIGVLLALSGCAGSRADLDFRSKVESDTATVGVTPIGVTISDTIVFRDPAKTGLKK